MYRLIAEHLSVRLLILQCVFSVGWVWPQLLFCLGMQLKVWLVPKHRMLLKILFTQVVYTYVFHSWHCSGGCLIVTVQPQHCCGSSGLIVS